MKKLLTLALVAMLAIAMVIPANAVHFKPGEYDLASDDSTVFDDATTYLWLDDGTAICMNISVWTEDDPDGTALSGEEIEANKMSLIAGTWYDYVDCGIGSEDDSAYPADLSGKIALIMRGTHTFTIKSDGAARNGAIATVIYNNYPDGELVDDDGTILTYADTNMSVDHPTTPMCFISSDIGARIATEYTGKLFVGTKAQYDKSLADIAAAAEAEAAAAEAASAEAAAAEAAAAEAAVVEAPVVTAPAAQTGDLLVLGLVGLAGAIVALKKRH